MASYPNIDIPSSDFTPNGLRNSSASPEFVTKAIFDNYSAITNRTMQISHGTHISAIENFVNKTYLGRSNIPVLSGFITNLISSGIITANSGFFKKIILDTNNSSPFETTLIPGNITMISGDYSNTMLANSNTMRGPYVYYSVTTDDGLFCYRNSTSDVKYYSSGVFYTSTTGGFPFYFNFDTNSVQFENITGSIDFTSKTDLNMTALNSVVLYSSGNTSDSNIIIKTDNATIPTLTSKDIAISAGDDVFITAADDINITAEDNINIVSNTSGILIQAYDDISVNAPHVGISSSTAVDIVSNNDMTLVAQNDVLISGLGSVGIFSRDYPIDLNSNNMIRASGSMISLKSTESATYISNDISLDSRDISLSSSRYASINGSARIDLNSAYMELNSSGNVTINTGDICYINSNNVISTNSGSFIIDNYAAASPIQLTNHNYYIVLESKKHIVQIISSGLYLQDVNNGVYSIFSNTDVELKSTAGDVILNPGPSQNIKLLDIPTSNPGGSGILWNENGFLRITG